MVLNTWWDEDRAQRYWMEITQRDTVGDYLLAPQRDAAGREQWSYTLVSQVQRGDRILHYRTNEPGGAAIVGWSEVTDNPSEGTITGQARGTRGRERGHPTTGPSWFVALGGLHKFKKLTRRQDLRRVEAQLLQLRTHLEQVHGEPVYFPFFRYRPGELRAQQGYLAKFPSELIDLLPELTSVRTNLEMDFPTEVEEIDLPSLKVTQKGQLTRIQDPELRQAIENHAVDAAIEHYSKLGCTDWETLGKPYDITLVLNGAERHIEVKGSTLCIETVELTINEVIHAQNFQPTDLVVVDGIHWARDTNGKITTSGGRMRIWGDWIPDEVNLFVRKYAYTLPAPDARQQELAI